MDHKKKRQEALCFRKRYVIIKVRPTRQLHQYGEALQCYNKSLELNPDFEPANKAKKEVEEIIN